MKEIRDLCTWVRAECRTLRQRRRRWPGRRVSRATKHSKAACDCDAGARPEHGAAVKLHTGVFEVVALARYEHAWSIGKMQRPTAHDIHVSCHTSRDTCCSLCAHHRERV
jgi:hypothetical protein